MPKWHQSNIKRFINSFHFSLRGIFFGGGSGVDAVGSCGVPKRIEAAVFMVVGFFLKLYFE